MTKPELPKAYDFKSTEPRIYAMWEKGGYFQPFNDPNVRGGSRTMHPENVGGSLTRAERQALIRAFDMGGQYYARTNASTYAANTAAP